MGQDGPDSMGLNAMNPEREQDAILLPPLSHPGGLGSCWSGTLALGMEGGSVRSRTSYIIFQYVHLVPIQFMALLPVRVLMCRHQYFWDFMKLLQCCGKLHSHSFAKFKLCPGWSGQFLKSSTSRIPTFSRCWWQIWLTSGMLFLLGYPYLLVVVAIVHLVEMSSLLFVGINYNLSIMWKYFVQVFRLVSLWFSFFSREQVVKAMIKTTKEVTFDFLSWLHR